MKAFLLIFAGVFASFAMADVQSTGELPEYLIFGKTLEDDTLLIAPKRRREVRTAVERFKDVPCFEQGVVYDEGAALAIDWSTLNSGAELEVCAFFAVSALGDRAEIRSFLLSNGFRGVGTYEEGRAIPDLWGVEGRGYDFSATYLLDDLPDSFGGWFGNRLWGAHGMSIGIRVDEAGQPLHVNVVFNRN